MRVMACSQAEVQSETDWDEVVDQFERMDLKEELICGIKECGFEKPTAVQQRAIIPINRGISRSKS